MKTRRWATLVFLIMSVALLLESAAQNGAVHTLQWMHLMRISTRPVTLPDIEGHLPLPVFTPEIKKYDGQRVQLDGYIIPIDKTGKTLALSAYAMAECFFCGKAGPASVMTVKLKKPNARYKTDQVATFRGRLRLNESDPSELFYVLEEAVEVRY